MKYFIEFAFDGTAYHGYQFQHNAISVQQVIEEKLSILYQEKMNIIGASRTDTGVHILQTFAHYESNKPLPTDLLKRLNFMLPKDIVIKKHFEVEPKSHARFDAIQREYHYYIFFEKDPFMVNRGYFYHYQKLDINVLNEAAAFLQTQTDFVAFCKRNSQNKTTLCRIYEAVWLENEKGHFVFRVKANRFLRGMVKGLVGTMIQVGKGYYTMDEFKKFVIEKDKTKVVFAVPPEGLYLTMVKYKDGVVK